MASTWGYSTSDPYTTWGYWSGDATSTGSTTWNLWNGLQTSTSSTATTTDLLCNYVWRNWITPQVNVHTNPRSELKITERMLAQDRERTDEEYRRAVEDRMAEAREAERLQREQLAKAEQVAKELLDSVLTPEQRAMRDKLKRFRVVAQDGETYEIETHRQMHNVFRMRGEQRIEELCLHHGGVPLSDNALAQKLMLETDVQQFRKIANRWDLMDNRKLIQGTG